MPAAKKPEDVFDEDISSFAKELDSPSKIMSDDIMASPRAQHIPAPGRAQQPQLSPKVPAFVSLAKYKELRLALQDIKGVSADMHRILEGLKANRDTGTEFLNETVQCLEKMEDNIDKVKGVLRV